VTTFYTLPSWWARAHESFDPSNRSRFRMHPRPALRTTEIEIAFTGDQLYAPAEVAGEVSSFSW